MPQPITSRPAGHTSRSRPREVAMAR